MCVYSRNLGAWIHARWVSPVPIWQPHNPPFLIRRCRCQFMSAGGFGVTVEQFNNVHFHAFPNLVSFLSLSLSLSLSLFLSLSLSLSLSSADDHMVYEKTKSRYHECEKWYKRKREYVREKLLIGRRIVASGFVQIRESVIKYNPWCLISNFAVCLVNAHSKANIQCFIDSPVSPSSLPPSSSTSKEICTRGWRTLEG